MTFDSILRNTLGPAVRSRASRIAPPMSSALLKAVGGALLLVWSICGTSGVAAAPPHAGAALGEGSAIAIARPGAIGLGSLAGPAQPRARATAQKVVAAVAGTATIRGQVVFNDRRNHGLFAARRGLDTTTIGAKCGTDGLWDDGTSCATHWLAAQYMVVDVIERDTGFNISDVNCTTSEKIGSATVDYRGEFTATFSVDDACIHDDYSDTAITLSVRTKFCGEEWCFSLDSDDDTPYTLYYPGASYVSPLLVDAGDDIDLAAMAFHPAGTASDAVNDHSIAANLYASLVDTVLTVHRDAGVPFYKEEFGELQYVYPSTQTSTATTLSASKVVDKVNTGWDAGLTPAHEYGHVLMLRAWDGDYGFTGVGISAGDSEAAVSQQIAFKEAWAELIAHNVFPLTNGCDLDSFDLNSNTPGTATWGALGFGTWWRLNVTKALCDWHDEDSDDDLSLAGAGDHFTADLSCDVVQPAPDVHRRKPLRWRLLRRRALLLRLRRLLSRRPQVVGRSRQCRAQREGQLDHGRHLQQQHRVLPADALN